MILGLINQVIPWEMPLYQQVLIGDMIVTALEFITGSIVNIWLGWGIGDYSDLPGNVIGQIYSLFCLIWLPVCLAGIVHDDWLFREERPHYKFI
ncbi:putative ABC transporter permease [Lacrimispora brassicae]